MGTLRCWIKLIFKFKFKSKLAYKKVHCTLYFKLHFALRCVVSFIRIEAKGPDVLRFWFCLSIAIATQKETIKLIERRMTPHKYLFCYDDPWFGHEVIGYKEKPHSYPTQDS